MPAPTARGSVPSAECGAQRKTLCFSTCHYHFKCPTPAGCGSAGCLRGLFQTLGGSPHSRSHSWSKLSPARCSLSPPPTPSRAFPPGRRETAPLVGSPACISCLLPHLLSVCTLPCSLPALAEPTYPGGHLLVLRGLLHSQPASQSAPVGPSWALLPSSEATLPQSPGQANPPGQKPQNVWLP